jgi:hypothetical protein
MCKVKVKVKDALLYAKITECNCYEKLASLSGMSFSHLGFFGKR